MAAKASAASLRPTVSPAPGRRQCASRPGTARRVRWIGDPARRASPCHPTTAANTTISTTPPTSPQRRISARVRSARISSFTSSNMSANAAYSLPARGGVAPAGCAKARTIAAGPQAGNPLFIFAWCSAAWLVPARPVACSPASPSRPARGLRRRRGPRRRGGEQRHGARPRHRRYRRLGSDWAGLLHRPAGQGAALLRRPRHLAAAAAVLHQNHRHRHLLDGPEHFPTLPHQVADTPAPHGPSRPS